VAAVLLAGGARADDSDILPQVRFENLPDFPAYDFYLKYGRGPSNPFETAYVTPVAPEGPTALEGSGRRITSVRLLAVPRGRKPPAPRGGFTWATEEFVDVLQSPSLPGIENASTIDVSCAGHILPYRVQVKDGALEVEPLPRERIVEGWTKAHTLRLVGGILLAVAAVSALLLVVLRRRQRKAA
jgi:hypothetical protein